MSDNNLRNQIQQAAAKAAVIKNGQISSSDIKLRPSTTNKFEYKSEVPFRSSKSLCESGDGIPGINFLDDDGEAL